MLSLKISFILNRMCVERSNKRKSYWRDIYQQIKSIMHMTWHDNYIKNTFNRYTLILVLTNWHTNKCLVLYSYKFYCFSKCPSADILGGVNSIQHHIFTQNFRRDSHLWIVWGGVKNTCYFRNKNLLSEGPKERLQKCSSLDAMKKRIT